MTIVKTVEISVSRAAIQARLPSGDVARPRSASRDIAWKTLLHRSPPMIGKVASNGGRLHRRRGEQARREELRGR